MDKLLIHATVWIYLNDILLSERSHTKDHVDGIVLYDSIYITTQNRQRTLSGSQPLQGKGKWRMTAYLVQGFH